MIFGNLSTHIHNPFFNNLERITFSDFLVEIFFSRFSKDFKGFQSIFGGKLVENEENDENTGNNGVRKNPWEISTELRVENRVVKKTSKEIQGRTVYGTLRDEPRMHKNIPPPDEPRKKHHGAGTFLN